MKTPANTLPTDVETLQELVLKLQSQVSTKQNKLDTLQSVNTNLKLTSLVIKTPL